MRRALAAWSLLLIGCGGGKSTGMDASGGASGSAGGSDAVLDRIVEVDVGPDVPATGGTGGSDAGPPADAGSDVGLDVDAAPDSARDMGSDAPLADGGGDATEVPPWSVTATLLTTDRAIDLFVARDERHVAYSLTKSDPLAFGCLGRYGVGDLKTLVTDPAPAVFAIDSYAGFLESRFTDDSQSVVFTQYSPGTNPCANTVGLRYAPAGGGASGFLNSGSYFYRNIAVAGSTVGWRSFGAGSNDPGTRGARKIGGSGASFGQTGGYLNLDPTGNSVTYDGGGEIRVAALNGTTKFVLNDGSLGPGAGYAWSPDGTLVAYGYHQATTDATATLTLRNADGSNLRTVATNCRCEGVVFSPDSAQLAYDVPEADGSVSFVIQPVSGGAAVKLPGFQPVPNTGGYLRLAFSADGRWLDLITPGPNIIYTAPVSPPGSFVMLSSPGVTKTGSFTSTPNHDHLAFTEVSSSGTSVVVTTPSGQRNRPVGSGATGVWYEQTGTSPSLVVASAASAAAASTLTLFPSDGSGSGKVLPIPGLPFTPQAFWVGAVFVYATNQRALMPAGSGSVVDLIAVSDDGSQSGLLASDVIGLPKTGRPDASRLFYARAPASGGGVYMFAPPGGTGGTGGAGGGGGRGGTGGTGTSGSGGASAGSGGAGGGAGTGNASGTTGSVCRGGMAGTGGAAGAGGTGGAAVCPGAVTLAPYRFSVQNGANSSVAIGDVTRDGVPDLAITSVSPGTFKIMTGYASGGVANGLSYYTHPNPTSVAIGTLRPNANAAVITISQAGVFQIASGGGDGTFVSSTSGYTTGAGAQQLVMGDFDADGDLDFAVACATDAKVILYVNEGNGLYNLHYPYAAERGTASAAAGDLNCDGKLDLVAGSPMANNVSVFMNDGTGKLTGRVVYPAGASARAVAVGDLNRDGAPDMFVANTADGTVGVYRNRGDGTFDAAVTFPAGPSPITLVLADLNRDGTPDAVVGSSSGGGVSVLLGQGDGTLAAPANIATTYNVAFLTAGDLNRDGRPDVVSANSDDSVTIWTASCAP